MASDSRQTVSLAQLRADMKAIGYTVAVRTNAEFKAATVSRDGKPINRGNVLTQEHLDEHRAFYDYRESHKVRDGDWIVVI